MRNNEWLEGFCATHLDRYAGIACVPNDDIGTAIAEIERIGANGVLRGVEIPCTPDMKPLFDPFWHPLWQAAAAAKLPVHLHTVSGSRPETGHLPPMQQRQAFAVYLTGFQVAMAQHLMAAFSKWLLI